MADTIVTLSTLQQTVARAIARFPAERARIERAAGLVACGHVAYLGRGHYAVQSQTDHGTVYGVRGGDPTTPATGCGCMDAQRNPGQSCKHAWAVDLLQVATEHQRRQDARMHLSEEELARLTAWKRWYVATQV